MPDATELIVCERSSICDRKHEHCCSFPHFENISCFLKNDPMYSQCRDGKNKNNQKLCRPLGHIVAVKNEKPL
jgi:hypothetical protein